MKASPHTNAQRKKLREAVANGDLELLYKITKIVAESDSIGEQRAYCLKYSNDTFLAEKNDLEKGGYCHDYLDVGLQLYSIMTA